MIEIALVYTLQINGVQNLLRIKVNGIWIGAITGIIIVCWLLSYLLICDLRGNQLV